MTLFNVHCHVAGVSLCIFVFNACHVVIAKQELYLTGLGLRKNREPISKQKFEGLSVINTNSVAPSTSDNGTTLISLFDAMSIQPPTTH